MSNSLQKQGKLFLSWLLQTRTRAVFFGALFGILVALIFLFFSFKIADPALRSNPFRWISKPHEWLMYVWFVIEMKIAVTFLTVNPSLSQLVILFSLAHLFAAAMVYSVIFLVLRTVFLRWKSRIHCVHHQ